MGALRTSMATCGYEDIPAFHRAEVMVAPALQTEGKQLQREQSVGMGSNGAAVRRSRSRLGGEGRRAAAARPERTPRPLSRRRERRGAATAAEEVWSSTSAASTRS